MLCSQNAHCFNFSQIFSFWYSSNQKSIIVKWKFILQIYILLRLCIRIVKSFRFSHLTWKLQVWCLSLWQNTSWRLDWILAVSKIYTILQIVWTYKDLYLQLYWYNCRPNSCCCCYRWCYGTGSYGNYTVVEEYVVIEMKVGVASAEIMQHYW